MVFAIVHWNPVSTDFCQIVTGRVMDSLLDRKARTYEAGGRSGEGGGDGRRGDPVRPVGLPAFPFFFGRPCLLDGR